MLFGSLAGISIADLLIAGILPGIIMSALLIGYVIVRCMLDPKLAPSGVSNATHDGAWTAFSFIWAAGRYLHSGGSLDRDGLGHATESGVLGAVATMFVAAFYGGLRGRR